MNSAQQLQDILQLRTAPVGISFHATAPDGVLHVPKAGPSGCSYWKRAADGETFYTEAPDHYNCPVGAYTHGVELPAAQGTELESVLGTMFQLGYVRPDEIPSIPRRAQPFGVAIYGPAANATETPDVVLIVANARQMMLLNEAAQAAGVGGTGSMMGRPTCMAIPQALQANNGVASLGCIGNRVYTELADSDLYYVVPGKHLRAVVEKLAGIVHANAELKRYHEARALA